MLLVPTWGLVLTGTSSYIYIYIYDSFGRVVWSAGNIRPLFTAGVLGNHCFTGVQMR